MSVVLRLYQALIYQSWRVLAVFFTLLFLGSWVSMRLFEGDAPIASAKVFWWYFIVTAATVGYGDYSPITVGGRVTGAFVMLVGIGLFAAVLTKLAEIVITTGQRGMQGMLRTTLSGHIVVFGYRPVLTSEMIRELKADPQTRDLKIVLCADDLRENPLPGEAEFVAGEDLASDDVTERAGVSRASRIIIFARDDNQTLAIVLAVKSAKAEGAKVVAYCEQPRGARNISRCDPGVQCVTSLAVPLLVQAVQDPGSVQVVQAFTSDCDNEATLYCLDLPAGIREQAFEDFLIWFYREYNALAVGISRALSSGVDLNPGKKEIVRGGMAIVYIADQRVRIDDWKSWTEK